MNPDRKTRMSQAFLQKSGEFRELTLLRGTFKCLYSFLERLGYLTCSESVELVTFDRRTILLDAAHKWVIREHDDARVNRRHEVYEHLRSVLTEEGTRPFYHGEAQLAADEKVDYLLCRAWPAKPWLCEDRETESYLLFVDPNVLPPLPACRRTEDYAAELATLAGDWFRWVREKREEARAVLNQLRNRTETAGDIVPAARQELESRALNLVGDTLVYPVHPRDFLLILRQFSQSGAVPAELVVRRIDALYTLCRPTGHCRCASYTADEGCRGVDAGEDTGERLELLRGLSYWRSCFWVDKERNRWGSDEWKGLRDSALDTLGKCVEHLRKGIDLGNADERTFLRHFLVIAIETLVVSKKEYWISDRRRPVHFRCPARLADLAIMVISESAWTAQMIEALVVALAEYCYIILKIPRRLDIESHLRQALRGEPALHTLKPFYRDHFFHAIEVCLMGDALLRSFMSEDWTMARQIISRCQGDHAPRDEDSLYRQWWVAALTHDIGYAIEVIDNALDMLSFFEEQAELTDFASNVKSQIHKLSLRDKLYNEQFENARSLGGDHGLIAAAHLSTLVKKMSYDDAQRYSGAIRAIAFHNSRIPVIDVKDDPVAGLLIMCDSLQCWRRAHLGFGAAPALIISRVLGGEDPIPSKVGNVRRFNFSMQDDHKMMWESSERLTVTLNYDDEVNRNSGVFFLWMDATYNLQRIRLSEWGFDIRLCLKTPLFRAPLADRTVSHLDRLEACAGEVGMPFVSNWFEQAMSDDPNRAVHHFVEDEYDVIMINVKELGEVFKKEPLLAGSISDFLRRLKTWSKYSEDRDLTEDSLIRPVIV